MQKWMLFSRLQVSKIGFQILRENLPIFQLRDPTDKKMPFYDDWSAFGEWLEYMLWHRETTASSAAAVDHEDNVEYRKAAPAGPSRTTGF